MAIPNISEIRDGKRVIVKKPELLLPAGNLEKLKIGDSVNIETDILAKYIKAQLKLFGGKFND